MTRRELCAPFLALVTLCHRMTRMGREPLAELSRLLRSGSHGTAHPHSDTSSRTLYTRVPPYLFR